MKVKKKGNTARVAHKFMEWAGLNQILYGDAFLVWWKKEGLKLFLKWAEKRGAKYTSTIKWEGK